MQEFTGSAGRLPFDDNHCGTGCRHGKQRVAGQAFGSFAPDTGTTGRRTNSWTWLQPRASVGANAKLLPLWSGYNRQCWIRIPLSPTVSNASQLWKTILNPHNC